MRWDDFRRSDNVEDDRGGGGSSFPGGGGLPIGGGGLGIGTMVVLGLVGWALGIDPRLLIGGAEMLNQGRQQQQAPNTQPRKTGVPTDAAGQFVAAMLGSTEDTWREVFQQGGSGQYTPPKLRLFDGRVQSACGLAQSAMGPFYCPRDRRVYLDTSFFRDLQVRFRGCDSNKACEFSQAYVIAHEVGHHVQNLLGILPKVQQMQQQSGDKTASNQLQVRVELQADCFAGIWANRANKKKNFIDPGDVDQALQTAAAIGDDTLQRKARGAVVPDSFTHGSADQRKRWFMTGFNSGQVSACNTFAGSQI